MDPAAQRTWKPLLDAPQTERANRILDQIAAALAPVATDGRHDLDGPSGRALFFAYLTEARGDGEWSALVDVHLDRAIELLAEAESYAALWNGFVGPAWATQHIGGRFLEPEDDDPNAELDETLEPLLTPGPWRGDYDLIGGLAGLAVYGLERLNRPVGRRLVEHTVERIGELAQAREGGLSWHTAPARLTPWQRAAAPNGYYNLGVAHGVPALAVVLAGACAAGVAVARARPLLDGAVSWILAQRRDGVSTFPSWIAGDERPAARLAWCYGDPGVAAALLAAGRAVDEPAWVEAALELGRHAAGRGRDELAAAHSGVIDAGLCHGAGGLALLFNRLWQDTPDPLFAAAANHWYGRVLDWHKPGLGVAGYRSWNYKPGTDPDNGTMQWNDDDSFLTGACGVGLSLLAAVSTVEPAWDRVLTASLPPA